MKAKVSANYKYYNEVQAVICEHVKRNKRMYYIFSILFVMGVLIGVVLVNNAESNSKDEITGYIKEVIQLIKKEDFQLDKAGVIKAAVFENLKLAVLIWFLGTTIIGIPFIFLVITYKGIRVGYTVSAMALALGNWKGCMFAIISMFLQSIVIIPAMLMLGVSSISLYKVLANYDGKHNIKSEVIRHTLFGFTVIIVTVILTIVTSYISSLLTVAYIKNLSF